MPPAAAIGNGGITVRRRLRTTHVAAIARLCGCATLPTSSRLPLADPAARHAQWLEHFAAHQFFVGRAARGRGDFAGDDVQQVVVGIAGAEAVGTA